MVSKAFKIYGICSFIVSIFVCISVATKTQSFYSACVYISQNNFCTLALCNLALFICFSISQSLKYLFFGSLRTIEQDHIYERSWYALTETCLAMTSFREEFGVCFGAMFITILGARIFHWVLRDRVDSMEQAFEIRLKFHIRMIAAIATISLFDILMLRFVLLSLISQGPTVMLMFGFEFIILLIHMTTTVSKYILNCIEVFRSQSWDAKSFYNMYLELISGFVRVLCYSTFFFIVVNAQRVPLHFFRELLISLTYFITKLNECRRYHLAIKQMNENYENATAEDLENRDRFCIVCREEMYALDEAIPENVSIDSGSQNRTPKKLPCGHVLHYHCLRSWLERQQNCPICRHNLLGPDVTARNNNFSATHRGQTRIARDTQNTTRGSSSSSSSRTNNNDEQHRQQSNDEDDVISRSIQDALINPLQWTIVQIFTDSTDSNSNTVGANSLYFLLPNNNSNNNNNHTQRQHSHYSASFPASERREDLISTLPVVIPMQ